MLQFFRKIIGSRFGALFAIGLLGLIALAFAASDVTGRRQSVDVRGDAVATIGDRKIDGASLSQAATSALENVKRQQPTMSMQGFLAAGGLKQVLDSLIDRISMAVWGSDHGIVASDRLVDSEIVKVPAFQGPDGKFSQALFQQLISQRGVNERLVREDIAQGLVARQLLLPAAFGVTMPRDLARRYAELLKESREGAIAALPAALFTPATRPDDKTLAGWYQTHRTRFIRPERRVVRYVLLTDAGLKNVAAPSEAEIAARYQADAPRYAALETRRITQLIVPSEAAARAVLAAVAKDSTLDAVAKEQGLATSALGPIDRPALAAQTSAAVSDAAFAAARGAIAGPARGALGWHVLRVDAIETRPARSLDQARAEIAAALAVEKRRKALADVSARIEDEFDKGGSLADAARELGLTLQQTGPLTADGTVYGKVGERAPAELARVLQTAFSMEQENQPQLAEVEAGKTVVLFDVASIAASLPAPLAEIKPDVTAAYMLDKGFTAAGEAGRRLLAETKRGSDLGKALASLGRPLPPPQPVAMSREQLAQMQQQSRQPVPPPLALLFSMAQGTTKLLPAPGNRGWFVVSLRKTTPGKVADADPLIATAQRELGKVAGDEYADALRRAIRGEIGVKTNPAAVQAVRAQLAGTAGAQ
ncbi:MAG: SurA N-terminal domain-containing protein [Novosphingobium sp.]